MIKCLVIHGSPRKTGNTYRITKAAMEAMAGMGSIHFDEIWLRDLKLPHCLGCFNCINRDEKLCPHSETIQNLESRIRAVDALIISSPTYILQISAEVKNLLDHFAYRFHRPVFFRQKALVVTSTAGAGAINAAKFLRDTLYSIGFNRVSLLPITCFELDYQPKPKAAARIANAGIRFYKEIADGKIHFPTWKQLVLYTAFRANATVAVKGADHKYWKEMGMLTKVYPNPVGIMQRLAASIAYSVMRRVIPSEI